MAKQKNTVYTYQLSDAELKKLGLEVLKTRIDKDGQEWVLLAPIQKPRHWWEVWRKHG